MVLERLRAATREAHARIEDVVGLLADPTLVRYRWFLSALYGFHAPLDARWAACAPRLADLRLDVASRRRLPLLVRDLRALDVEPAALSLCATVPALGTTARALGVLYVVEGSTLGGQVLAERVARTLGLGPDRGASFLVGHGPLTRLMWGAVCARLEGFAEESPDAVYELVSAAQESFETLRRWFEERAA